VEAPAAVISSAAAESVSVVSRPFDWMLECRSQVSGRTLLCIAGHCAQLTLL